jgi:hypothetical protein
MSNKMKKTDKSLSTGKKLLFIMLPAISILVAPNAALYALRDMKDWKKIFYDKGNLGKIRLVGA